SPRLPAACRFRPPDIWSMRGDDREAFAVIDVQSQQTTEGEARTRDGTVLAYSLHDRGAGAPRIALIHSLAMDRAFWRPVAERLAPHASVLVYDCRGHGRSGKPPGPYTVELFADDLADLLDHVGWQKSVV